jgi:hypothetical protein
MGHFMRIHSTPNEIVDMLGTVAGAKTAKK